MAPKKKRTKKPAKNESGAILAQNRKAFFNYEIVEKKEAGLVLNGNEVKSVRFGKVSIREAYARFRKDELYLVNAHISPYQPKQKNQKEYSPTRSRKLLLHKSELVRLYGKAQEKGLTLIPLAVFLKNNRIKVEIGVGKGKKKYDKREAIKKRDEERKIREYT